MSKNISNPIPAKQIVNVNLNWDCLEEPTCNTLEQSLQQIVNVICELESIDGSCLQVSSFKEIIEKLIEKSCETTSTTDPGTTVDPVEYCIDTCVPGDWNCDSLNNCITADTKDPEALIQILFNAVVANRTVIKDLCSRLDTLENQVNTLQLELENGCC